MTDSQIPIACTLPGDQAARQGLGWSDLKQHAMFGEALPAGYLMHLPVDMETTVEDLVATESVCCAFLSFAVETFDGYVRLEVTSENPDAVPFIASLLGPS